MLQVHNRGLSPPAGTVHLQLARCIPASEDDAMSPAVYCHRRLQYCFTMLTWLRVAHMLGRVCTSMICLA